MTYENNTYKAFLEGLKNPEFYRAFIDDIDAQFNNEDWRLFSKVMPQQGTRTWYSLMDKTPISVMASSVADVSPTPLRATQGVSEKYGKIPTFGHGFEFGIEEAIAIQEANYTDDALVQFCINKYRDRFGSIVRGHHNRINFMLYDTMFNGKSSMTKENDPQGVKWSISAGIPEENMLVTKGAATARWTNTTNSSTADPIGDLQRAEQILEDRNVNGVVHIMNKKTFKEFLAHPKVALYFKDIISAYGLNGLFNINSSILAAALREKLQVAPIIIKDFKATVEEDGKERVIENVIPDGKVATMSANTQDVFSLYNSSSIYNLIDSPMIQTTTVDNGLLAVKKTWDVEGLKVITEIQGIYVPVMNRPENFVILDTTKNASDGILSA